MTERIAKLLAVASMALLASLVSFGNLTDYGSNLHFVEHVMRMDTTFPGNANLYRAITSPVLQHAGYDAIIFLETATAVLCWISVVAMWRALRQERIAFARAKRWAVAGLALGYLTWQVCFMSIGGEWFDMWMSHQWNGEESAFRFFITFLVILIFVTRREPGLRERVLAG
ncbi:small integral membrane protein [Burkholderia sp. YI23]|nr:small integral membrane protein [Burkholderia sp. YI23]